MARYLYAGDAFGAAREAGGRIDTTSAARGGTGVALLCDLLRVADAWCLDHLKSACEVRLAACIVDAADAVALLSHAAGCGAQQLFDLCAFHVRRNSATHAALTPELHELVFGRHEQDDAPSSPLA